MKVATRRLLWIGLSVAMIARAQIGGLATTSGGTVVYFVTSLRQRGTTQSDGAVVLKVFRLTGRQLELVEQSPPFTNIAGAVSYSRPAVSGDGTVRAINSHTGCVGYSTCFFRELNSTRIETPLGVRSYAGTACLSANGRFAALYGTTNQSTSAAAPWHSLRLVDLTSGQVTLLGTQAAEQGQFVAEDGSALVLSQGRGVRLVRPNGNVDLTPERFMKRALLAADASRVVYEALDAPAEIRVLDGATGSDRALGPGSLPILAGDGRRISYLCGSGAGPTGLCLGDAVSGVTRRLYAEREGIVDQTITNDGTAVFAATARGRLLAIDSTTGEVRQLLGAAGPAPRLLTVAVAGSYNELTGDFADKAEIEVRVAGVPVPVLGRTARGLAIQIPWEIRPDPNAEIVFWPDEPAWEQVIGVGVSSISGAALPVGVAGPGGPAYYALHEDWSRVVSREDPARPGEIIHLYGTGYGPVDGTPKTGEPAPADRLYRITTPCDWRAIGTLADERPFEVLFAGLAPGLIGIYQFDFRIPHDYPYALFNAFCRTGSIYAFQRTVAIEVRP